MRTIEAVASVNDDGTIIAKGPFALAPGKHRVVIVVDEKVLPDVERRPLPSMAAFRDSLGASTYPGNSVIDMREDERS